MSQKNTLSPEINDLLDTCSDGPVQIARDGSFDVIIMRADVYADLLDKVQTTETVDALSDPLLSDIAEQFGPKSD